MFGDLSYARAFQDGLTIWTPNVGETMAERWARIKANPVELGYYLFNARRRYRLRHPLRACCECGAAVRSNRAKRCPACLVGWRRLRATMRQRRLRERRRT